ncbi:B3 domain-containing protein Os01g0234100-like [Triticum aestivum]|uniref:B3 domain-containing protein Os01g0234100-like n=1 Tax=Triticum aestivum TaxID=4565 RepID=UPI001D01B3A1|nr:B3 domain-containing protein Os01g0234100-like [Triticum aestivum]
MPSCFLKSAKVETGQKTALANPKLTLVHNGRLENEQVKRPSSGYEVRTITMTYKRKRRWPANSTLAHKPMLIDSGSSSDAKSDKGDDYEPPTKSGRPASLKTAKSKRGRPPGSKSAKNKEDGIGSSEPGTDFNVVKSFRSFKVIVGGSAIDDKQLPTETRRAYHGLCHDRKSLLHGRLQKNLEPLLAAGVIIETVRIAKGIRASAASPSREDLTRWKKDLESFEMMGMDVGFMRERVNSLLTLLKKADHLHEGYDAAKLERARATEGLRALESKLSSIKNALKEIDVELQEMAS